MHRTYQAQTALLLGLLLTFAVGCGEQSIDSTRAQAAEPAPGPMKQPDSAPKSQSSTETEPAAPLAAEPAPAPSVPPIAPDRVLTSSAAEPAAAAADGGVPTVSVGTRTIINQEAPQDVQDKWRGKLATLAAADSSFRLVDDPTAADWVVEIAALERPDVIYLAPTKKLVEKMDDDYLRMSPPGEAAVEWLKLELGHLERTSALVKIQAEAAAAADAEDLKQQVADAEAPPADAPLAPSSSAPTEPSGGSAPGPAFMEKSMMRAFMFTREGPAEDLKALVVQEQSGIYHTANRTQALLGTYGKMIPGNKFLGRPSKYEQRTVMQEIDSVRRFTTIERQGHGTGSDFLSFAGGTRQAWQLIDLAGQVGGGRTNEISFEIVGMRLDQSDTIRALNDDPEALNYFNYVQSNREVPCLILENLVFTSYAASQGTSFNLGGSAKSVLTGDGGGAEFDTERSTSNQFTSPIVRGYQMYQVKLYRGQVVDLVYVDP